MEAVIQELAGKRLVWLCFGGPFEFKLLGTDIAELLNC